MTNTTSTAPATTTGANPRTLTVAYLLWFFLGGLGAHKFYLGKTGVAISYILTFGWLTIGLWIDLFTMRSQVERANQLRSL
jgi:TM2 domain-containing membrane protein YozV